MNKILWIDLEMTGLDVETERIIEVAAIITDTKFNEISQYQSVVRQDQKFLDDMDEWNTRTHTESGLKEMVPKGQHPGTVENELIGLLDEYFAKEDVIIAGNSISQDRLFLDRYFPDFSNRLHYRMIDVSSFKIIFKEMYNVDYEKKNSHRALDDIRESIGELKNYLQYINV